MIHHKWEFQGNQALNVLLFYFQRFVLTTSGPPLPSSSGSSWGSSCWPPSWSCVHCSVTVGIVSNNWTTPTRSSTRPARWRIVTTSVTCSRPQPCLWCATIEPTSRLVWPPPLHCPSRSVTTDQHRHRLILESIWRRMGRRRSKSTTSNDTDIGRRVRMSSQPCMNGVALDMTSP